MSLVRNERLKLAANFLNALGIGLIGIAVLRPVVEAGDPSYTTLAGWSFAGLAIHAAAHYILGYLR
ncbi:hypothetical protein EO213_19175 [Paracoccus denitrificans]|jgi:hypothetical protein|uniref:Uncharacterized protein n=1 Tax=Paracoccus denitrificans (strain Pd 1222) TaxID=318586 RepID=A1B8J5_PARDP|nr:conserved hypothetical protein [Paracoccus denitrificans PD1222]MBB4628055.1 hypothetical protein [Paracoccus denitrificans]QAR28425.1 hypothetical protein EO213_19175 [Paracoccus denitrificans]SDJ12796.1 hypothetical protein SAMN04244581_03229 [Paracoccus denitrificans]SFR14145.1 hypothetical protein SAMN04244569_03233 [Paracoccus denitrificans]